MIHPAPGAGFEEVTAAEVRDMQAAGSPPVLLLDVRSSLEFDTRCGLRSSGRHAQTDMPKSVV